MIDSFGRKINYARISITDRCNLRCRYCMLVGGVDQKECREIMRYEQIDELIKILEDLGINKIRFTGGEPLVRRGIDTFIEKIISKYKNIDFYITTNGIGLDKYAQRFKDAGLKGVNISIDTFSKQGYYFMTRGGEIEKALTSLYKVIEVGIPKIKLNAVLTKNLTDLEIIQLCEFTKNFNVDVRFIELMPIGDCTDFANENYISPDIIFGLLPELTKVPSDDISSPATYYKLPNSIAKIGLIRPMTCKFCENCNRIRVTADGMLKHCLHSDEELYLFNSDTREVILKAISIKPKEHDLENKTIERNMKRIGG